MHLGRALGWQADRLGRLGSAGWVALGLLPLTHACVLKVRGQFMMERILVRCLLLVLREGPCSPAVNSPVGADTAVWRHKSPASNTIEAAGRVITSVYIW